MQQGAAHRLLAGGRSIIGLQSLCRRGNNNPPQNCRPARGARHAHCTAGRRASTVDELRTRKETFSGASLADGALVSAASSAGLAPALPVVLYTFRNVPECAGRGRTKYECACQVRRLRENVEEGRMEAFRGGTGEKKGGKHQ